MIEFVSAIITIMIWGFIGGFAGMFGVAFAIAILGWVTETIDTWMINRERKAREKNRKKA